MVEKPNHFDRYEQMSPQELNQELQGIFGLIPHFNSFDLARDILKSPRDITDDERKMVVDDFERRRSEVGGFSLGPFPEDLDEGQIRMRVDLIHRERSELFPSLNDRLVTLHKFSKATPSFTTLIHSEFKQRYFLGLWIMDGELFDLLFDRALPEGGGIFDQDNPNKIKMIERRWYKEKTREYLNARVTTEKLLDRSGAKPKTDRSEKGGVMEQLGIWRQEFIGQYGEEP